jgi:hypothetical protein
MASAKIPDEPPRNEEVPDDISKIDYLVLVLVLVFFFFFFFKINFDSGLTHTSHNTRPRTFDAKVIDES